MCEFDLSPDMVGLSTHPVSELRGADAEHNAGVARRLFDGAPGAARVAVLLNTGVALAVSAQTAQPSSQEEFVELVRGGVARAAEAIDSGKAAALLQRWAAATKG